MKQGRTTRAGDTVRAMVSEIEADVNRLIVYVNDEVVPEVRRGSSHGLRVLAEQLGRLAEQLDRGAPAASSAGGAPAGAAGQPTPPQSARP